MRFQPHFHKLEASLSLQLRLDKHYNYENMKKEEQKTMTEKIKDIKQDKLSSATRPFLRIRSLPKGQRL